MSPLSIQVLDAPALADDFYLNLVDWSAQNLLAVGLDSCVYLWSAHTSKVQAVCSTLAAVSALGLVVLLLWCMPSAVVHNLECLLACHLITSPANSPSPPPSPLPPSSTPLSLFQQVTKLCDLAPGDNVCSVSWSQRGTYLSVGTGTGEVQVSSGTLL